VKQLTLEYTVSNLGMMGSLIEMKLKALIQAPMVQAPVEEAPTEEEVHQMLENLQIKPFKKGSEEKEFADKFVTAYLDSFKEKMPGLFEQFEDRPRRTGMVAPMATPLYDAVLYLTQEQYADLGSPPLLSKLRFKARMIQ